jgi:uncharacterized protein (TIGR03067 family)
MSLRRGALHSAMIGAVILVAAGTVHSQADKEKVAERVARLIGQLGDDRFDEREAASRELEEVGDPALGSLRKAAASSRDAEIRRRAEQIIELIAARARREELARWAGSWRSPDGVWLKITEDRWSSGTPTFGPVAGTMWITEIEDKMVRADFAVKEGPTKGKYARAIFRLDGDALHYCATYDGQYPTEFKTVGNCFACVFRRVKE